MHSYMPPLFKRNSNRITTVQKSRSPTAARCPPPPPSSFPTSASDNVSPMIWWKGLTKWPVKGAGVMKKIQVAGLSGKEPTQCGGLGRRVRKQCLDWDECKSPALRHQRQSLPSVWRWSCKSSRKRETSTQVWQERHCWQRKVTHRGAKRQETRAVSTGPYQISS